MLLALALGWLLNVAPWSRCEVSLLALGQGLLATLPMVVGLLLVTHYPLGPLKRMQQVADELIVPLFRDCNWGQLLTISLLAGVGEEFLFRGVVQVAVERWTALPWLAILLASLLFGLAHPITVTYAVLAGLIGVYLGVLLHATGNLVVPVVAHAAYDFVALVYLLRRDRRNRPALRLAP